MIAQFPEILRATFSFPLVLSCTKTSINTTHSMEWVFSALHLTNALTVSGQRNPLPQHEPHINVEQRCGEEEAVDEVERAAVAGQPSAGIFHAGFAFDERFR